MITETPVATHMDHDSHAVARLTDRVLFRVSGPGTDDFLQGQLSQNLKDVTSGRAPRAAACTPKGRAYLLTRLIRDGEDILLSIPASIADPVATQLNKYLMLFRGTTMERLERGLQIGLFGEAAARSLAGESSSLPQALNDTVALATGHLVRTNPTTDGLDRFELWLPDGPDEQLTSKLESMPRSSTADWDASEIAAGIAELSPQTQETWVPQMLNWQHLEGIHFKKGCYTGQEVVARMHFLGQLKKSLFRFSAQDTQAPAPGTAIHRGDKAVGDVVRSVAFDNGDTELLAVVRHDAVSERLTLGTDGPELALLPIPYPVPEREPADSEASDT